MQEETIVIDTSNIKRDAMEKKHSFAYSVGHFSNDLCASVLVVVCIALTMLVVLDLVVLDVLYLVLDDSPITVFSQPCTGLVY